MERGKKTTGQNNLQQVITTLKNMQIDKDNKSHLSIFFRKTFILSFVNQKRSAFKYYHAETGCMTNFAYTNTVDRESKNLLKEV